MRFPRAVQFSQGVTLDSTIDVTGAATFSGGITESGSSGKTLTYTGTTGSADTKTANSITTGTVLSLLSSATAIATTGRIFYSYHSGATSTSGILNEFKSDATDETVIAQVTATGALALGKALNVSVAALTTGVGIDCTDNTALTTGQLVSIASAATAITTTGRMFLLDHTGTTSTSGMLFEVRSAATDETVIASVKASGVLAAGCVLFLSAATMQTGKALALTDLDALTTGIGIHIASAATAIATTGRLFYSNHTGATSTSGTLNEFASAATDETIIAKVTASGLLAAGKAFQVSAAAMTTGTAVDVPDLDALTSGIGLNVASNSADATARFLAKLTNTNAAAVGTVPLYVKNAAVQGTGSKFVPMIRFTEGTKVNTLWLSIDGTTPDGNLTGVVGDMCFNGPAGRSFYCDADGANWTASNA